MPTGPRSLMTEPLPSLLHLSSLLLIFALTEVLESFFESTRHDPYPMGCQNNCWLSARLLHTHPGQSHKCKKGNTYTLSILTCCPGLFLSCRDKTPLTKKINSGKERDYFTLRATVHHLGMPRQEVKAEAQSRN